MAKFHVLVCALVLAGYVAVATRGWILGGTEARSASDSSASSDPTGDGLRGRGGGGFFFLGGGK